MSLQRAYHHLSEEKRAAIMALAREGFSGARIARHCGISEATVSREFSRQFPQGIPLKERRKRYEAAAAHTRYRENRKKSKPKGKLLPRVIETAEKLIRRGYSPEQMANTVLKGLVSTVSIYRWLYAGFLLYGDRSLLRHKGRRRVQRKEGKAKKYTAGRSVHTRPASIESRGEFGHFEVDTVESGRNGTGCVFTDYSARSDHLVRRSEHRGRTSEHLLGSFRRMKSGSNSAPNSTKGGRLWPM